MHKHASQLEHVNLPTKFLQAELYPTLRPASEAEAPTAPAGSCARPAVSSVLSPGGGAGRQAPATGQEEEGGQGWRSPGLAYTNQVF